MPPSYLTRRNAICAIAALSFALLGYGVATFQAKRAHAMEEAIRATTDLWYFSEVLRVHKGGDTSSAINATALKADLLVSQIAETEDRELTAQQQEFRIRVLKAYKSFRDTNEGLYALPSQLEGEARQEMLHTQRAVGDFLTRATR
jgi:hypothetical protein